MAAVSRSRSAAASRWAGVGIGGEAQIRQAGSSPQSRGEKHTSIPGPKGVSATREPGSVRCQPAGRQSANAGQRAANAPPSSVAGRAF